MLRSKLNLERNILEIANVFKKHTIYFPVRLDNRGRLYCLPHYLNYPSSELAKSLLLFSEPGEMKLDSKNADYYLRIYGANSFGLDKKSFSMRNKWVTQNIDNIINFENGILINQAKKKLLFIAFCMEYRRYINSVNAGEKVFKPYLPIQLDATCNGFQHLSMLSNESKMFKELNLFKSTKDEDPKYFYNYILHLLTKKIKEILDQESSTRSKNDLDSHVRLSKFILTRSVVKKALMTIPYNAGKRTISTYIKEALKFHHYDELSNTELSNKELLCDIENDSLLKTKKKTSEKKSTKYVS